MYLRSIDFRSQYAQEVAMRHLGQNSETDTFERAREATKFGAAGRVQCGANTKRGLCARVPVQGFDRCLLHMGRAADRLWERRCQDFSFGRIGPYEFARMVRRRAANRLQRAWTRDPWAPGCTIDLGAHEAEFRDALRRAGYDAARLAPAVLDWASWRWRRAFLDGQGHAAWTRALLGLPERVQRAGVPPAGWVPTPSPRDAAWGASRASNVSKRRVPDVAFALKPVEFQYQNARALSPEEWIAHRAILAPTLARLNDEAERDAVGCALAALIDGRPGAHENWMRVVAGAR